MCGMQKRWVDDIFASCFLQKHFLCVFLFAVLLHLLLLSILILMCLVVPSWRSKQDIVGRNVRKLTGLNLKNCSLPRIPICSLTRQAKAHTISYTFQIKPSHGQNKTRNRPICIPQMSLTPNVPHPKMSLTPNVPHPKMSLTPKCPSPQMSLS